MAVLVKVQLPVDFKLARDTGKVYADMTDPNVLIYARGKKHFWQGRDDELRAFMLSALGGAGSMKSFFLADWDGTHWVIDYAAGFQPMQGW
jgi:hypothetical protein